MARVKLLRMSTDLFLDMMRGRHPAYEVIGDSMPEDALIVDMGYDLMSNPPLLKFVIESKSFPQVANYLSPLECPEIKPIFKTIDPDNRTTPDESVQAPPSREVENF